LTMDDLQEPLQSPKNATAARTYTTP